MSVKKIAILFSGTGSNLKNIFEQLHKKTFNTTTIEVALTITNKSNAKGIKYSKEYDVEPIIIDHTLFSSREEFDQQLVATIKEHNIELTVLAGFMRILTPIFTSQIKAINLHPSILPLFKGENAIKKSYESDMRLGGVSVHFVSEELDGGKIIAQEAFQKKEMNLEEYEAKIHEIEYKILPKSIIYILC